MHEPVVDVHCLLRRNVQLIAQLAEVGDPDAQHSGEADVDVPGCPEPEFLVADVGGSDRCQQLTRLRALDVDLGVGGGYVGDERASITRGELPPHPGQRVPVGGVGGHHVEVIVVQLGDGEIGLERAAIVQPLGVGDGAWVRVDAVGRDPVELAARVTALHGELCHEGHVHEDHAVPARLVFGFPVGVPLLAAPGQLAGYRRFAVRNRARGCVPVGSLPAADIAEERALGDQAVVDRR